MSHNRPAIYRFLSALDPSGIFRVDKASASV